MALSRGNTAEAVMPRRQLWSASGSSYGASGFNLLEFPEAPRTLRIWSRSELLSEVVGLSYGGAGNPDVVTAALAAVDAISLAGLRGILWLGFLSAAPGGGSEITLLGAAVLGGHAELAQRLARSGGAPPWSPRPELFSARMIRMRDLT